jgi:hypothetical protein
MTDVLEVTEEKRHARTPCYRRCSIACLDLLQVLEAARWTHLSAVLESLEIACAVRLGHPDTSARSGSYVRVRREVGNFVHHNRLSNMGVGA